MQTVKKIILLAAVVFLAIIFASVGLAIVCVIICVLLLRRVGFGVLEFVRGIFGGVSKKDERTAGGAKVIDAEFEIIESRASDRKNEG